MYVHLFLHPFNLTPFNYMTNHRPYPDGGYEQRLILYTLHNYTTATNNRGLNLGISHMGIIIYQNNIKTSHRKIIQVLTLVLNKFVNFPLPYVVLQSNCI